jgi:hypothetical protein
MHALRQCRKLIGRTTLGRSRFRRFLRTLLARITTAYCRAGATTPWAARRAATGRSLHRVGRPSTNGTLFVTAVLPRCHRRRGFAARPLARAGRERRHRLNHEHGRQQPRKRFRRLSREPHYACTSTGIVSSSPVVASPLVRQTRHPLQAGPRDSPSLYSKTQLLASPEDANT